MNQEVGSIMGYLYKLYPVQVYEEEIPQDFAVRLFTFHRLPRSMGWTQYPRFRKHMF